MSRIIVEPRDGSAAFVAWRDGHPSLGTSDMARAVALIGTPCSLTPEGPTFTAGWGSVESAAALLATLFPDALLDTEPDVYRLTDRDEGAV